MIKVATPEENFLDYMFSLKRHTAGRLGVIIHLSALSKVSKSGRSIDMAFDTLKPLLKKHEGQIFQLSNQDIIVLLKDIKRQTLEDHILKVQYLFRDDSFYKSLENLERENDLFTWHDLSDNYQSLLMEAKKYAHRPDRITGPEQDVVIKLNEIADARAGEANDNSKSVELTGPKMAEMEAAQKSKARMKFTPVPSRTRPRMRYFEIVSPKPKPLPARNFTPHDLSSIIHALDGVDCSPYIKRQDIQYLEDDKCQSVFIDRFIPLETIQEKILPTCDLNSDTWLANWMREWLDRKVLENVDIANPRSSDDFISTCVRSSVEAIQSKAFEEFHKRCATQRNHKIILEFSIQDILNNVGSYLAAREYVTDLGYRICIGRLTPYVFITCDLKKLGPHFQKITWDPFFTQASDSLWYDQFKAEIHKEKIHSTILCNTENAQALAFGQAVGIRLYQGSYLSK